ncbi:MAG TPA: hypothetical protein VGR35_20325 [Tepidisphaeraceae bacterium]|nr:hypothetical protein [Tepidisphaeraceae bacterium]
MSTEPAGPIPAPPQHALQQESPRRTLVLLFIFATAIIFIVLLAVLFFRWAGAQEPSSVVVVQATPAFDGAEIIVEGVALRAPYRVTVDSWPESSIPFYVDRGSYTLRIVRDEQTLYSGDFVIRHNQVLRIDLAKLERLLPAPATASTRARQRR